MKRTRKRGQSIVEFALILPVFVIMLALFVDAAQLLYAKGMTFYGAYTAARAASVEKSYTEGHKAAQVGVKNMPSIMNVDNAKITLKTDGAWQKGNLLTADAQMTVRLFLGLPDGRLRMNQEFTVHTPIKMMIENDNG